MTNATRNASTKTATIWPIDGSDPYTGVTYATPYTIQVAFEQGGTRQYSDTQGQVFTPSSIYWFEYDSTNGVPGLNWGIALGDFANLDPVDVDGVEYIRVAKLQDGFRQTDDVMVLT